MMKSPTALSRLISPADVDTFFHDVWGQSDRCFRQSLGRGAADLLSLEGFELIIGTLNRAHEGWLHLARGGLKPLPSDMVDEEGMVDLKKIRAAFAGGETLYLTKAERVSLPLMRLCRSVELELAARGVALRRSVNAHVFLTPPESQGFPAHRDEHASFVVQLEGSKEWTTYGPAPGQTAAEAGAFRPGGVGPDVLRSMSARTHHLQAGDVLYMPEWWPHEARASSSHSLHVTLRVFPLRWVDLVLELCSDNPALSGAVPPGLTARPEDLSGPLVSVIRSKEFLESLTSRLGVVARRRAIPRSLLPEDGLRQALGVDEIHPDTLLVRTEGTACAVCDAGGDSVIEFSGGGIRGPAIIRPVFEYVARVMALRPRDLPPVAGGDYDRLGIARAMVRDGLLRVDDRDPLRREESRDQGSGPPNGVVACVEHPE